VSRLFAATYPAETAGLILLESSHEDEIDAYRDLYGVDSPDAEWIDGGDLLDIDATERALREEARSFGPMPLIVIRADRYEDVLHEALWRRTQADLATISDDGVFAIARDSGHFLLLDAPGVVGTAVTAVVTAIDTGAPLPGCREVFAGMDVRCPG